MSAERGFVDRGMWPAHVRITPATARITPAATGITHATERVTPPRGPRSRQGSPHYFQKIAMANGKYPPRRDLSL